MQELPDFLIKTGEGDKAQVAGMKVHRLAYKYRRILYGSFVGAANSAKLLRGAIRHGAECTFMSRDMKFENLKGGDDVFTFRQTGIGKGYVHAVIEPIDLEAFAVFGDGDDEWHRELMRVSTIPVLREWVPWLRERVKADARSAEVDCFNCDMQVYNVDDSFVARLVTEGGESGAIVLPECETDMDTLGTLPDYIRAYAQRMVESAGSSLRPLLDPKREQVQLPPLRRQPFVPQAWLIESARRAMA